jgi:CrcB protein
VKQRGATVAAIAAGGAIGALLRAGLSEAGPVHGWPITTLAVNIGGTVLLAAVAAVLAWRPRLPHWLHPLAAVGFCGSITTFSTMQVEAVVLMRDGMSGTAVVYLIVSVAVGLAAVMATRRLLRTVLA